MKKLILLTALIFSFHSKAQITSDLNLMPWPQEIQETSENFLILPDFTITVNKNPSNRIKVAGTKFLRRLSGRSGIFFKNGFIQETASASLEINYERTGNLQIHEVESYELSVSRDKIKLSATTDIGIVYGLETLLQLLDNNADAFFFHGTEIKDFPRFTWRGIMIDVARHFQPLEVLKRNLDAMAAVKMNVFHWHLSDDQGFRVEIKSHPKLTEKGSDGLYYTQNQIKDLVKYAGDRGIRVVPEIDVPGHATAILAAYPEIGSVKDTAYTIERNSGIFHPTLDPTNERTYEILDDVFREMAALFPDKYFHIGGDENEGKHWDKNPEIQTFKKKHDLKTNHDLQTFFNIRLEEILQGYGKTLMGWEEIMTDKMPTTALIHSWKGINEGVEPGGSLVAAAKRGYNTILSNGYYIDLLLSAKDHYSTDPMPRPELLTPEERKRILGGEATMWSELVTDLSIDSRLWPRSIAIAERFWSNKNLRDFESMYKRMEPVSFRLEDLGISHIRNRDVILRNLTGNQSIQSLVKLTKAYEPLKVYTRNAGGIEYQTYSPFTLFADASNADASDALLFDKLTSDFISSHDETAKEKLLQLLSEWVKNNENFEKLTMNPLLQNIAPLSKNLSTLSKQVYQIISEGEIKVDDYNALKANYFKLEKPVQDVEFASLNSFKRIIEFYVQKNSEKLDLNNSSIHH
jgi:hexosaminidase